MFYAFAICFVLCGIVFLVDSLGYEDTVTKVCGYINLFVMILNIICGISSKYYDGPWGVLFFVNVPLFIINMFVLIGSEHSFWAKICIIVIFIYAMVMFG